MSIEFSEHELAVMERMTPRHKALMAEISPEARKSFAKNVKVDNIDLIQSWIGTDEEIERMLFWNPGGKFDDPAWQSLKPLDGATQALWEKAKAHFADLRKAAVKSQRIADLTLYSHFNPGLLYTGVAPAVRCDEKGAPSPTGSCFKGVEFRVIGSVDESVDLLTIMPAPGSGYETALGAWAAAGPTGIPIYGGDNYSVQQLAQLIDRRLAPLGCQIAVKNSSGQAVTLDARDLRRSGANSVSLGWGEFLTLHASKMADTPESAQTAADQIVSFFYERFGLERECINIGRNGGNFHIMRDENFDRFIAGKPGRKGLVMLTATLVCRRCRREMRAFRDLAKGFGEADFCLVNLNSPLFKFYDRVFGDMGGGNAEEFRKNAAGVTPFTIVYKPSKAGGLEYCEYYGTGKADACPEYEKQVEMIKKDLYS